MTLGWALVQDCKKPEESRHLELVSSHEYRKVDTRVDTRADTRAVTSEEGLAGDFHESILPLK